METETFGFVDKQKTRMFRYLGDRKMKPMPNIKPKNITDEYIRMKRMAKLAYGNVLDIGFNQTPNPYLKNCDGYDLIVDEYPENYNFVSEHEDSFETHGYDCVIAGEVIEHVFDMDKFLTFINRVLKNRGLFILSTPNPHYIGDILISILGKRPQHDQHIYSFTEYNMDNLLKRYGFKFKKLISNGFYLPKVYLNIPNRCTLFNQKYIYVYQKIKREV